MNSHYHTKEETRNSKAWGSDFLKSYNNAKLSDETLSEKSPKELKALSQCFSNAEGYARINSKQWKRVCCAMALFSIFALNHGMEQHNTLQDNLSLTSAEKTKITDQYAATKGLGTLLSGVILFSAFGASRANKIAKRFKTEENRATNHLQANNTPGSL